MIFANIMSGKKKKNGYWLRLLRKYRFVIMTNDSFEERFSTSLSKLNSLLLLSVCIFVCVFCSLLLIAYTPLINYVPGKSSVETQKNLIELSLRSDSLQKTLLNRAIYLENINNIILGKELVSFGEVKNTAVNDVKNVVFETSKEDSLLRLSVEAENKGSLYLKNKSTNEYVLFFPPVVGMISDPYNSKTKHFGVDVVAKEKSRISSVLEGTVVVSHWTSETGYVIVVQHKNDFLSLYKHNSLLLKRVGDFVKAGEHLAIIGNSGELSSGPHLHFELWYKGEPVNPENYISF